MAARTRNCYTRDGTLIRNIAYQSCSNDTSHDSACCGINHEGAKDLNVVNDVCESNGLCQNYEAYDGTNEGVKAWWRQGCTDPTWKSEYCLGSVCNDPLWQVDNAGVQKCGSNSWCCGDENCCYVSSSLFALAATVGPTSTLLSSLNPASISVSNVISSTSVSNAISSTSVSNAISSTISNGGVSSLTASPSSTPGSTAEGLSTGAKAGIGSGVAVIVILLATTVILAMKLRKRKQEEITSLTKVPQYTSQEKQQSTAHVHGALPAELHGDNVPAEMGGTYVAELPGGPGAVEVSADNGTVVDSGLKFAV